VIPRLTTSRVPSSKVRTRFFARRPTSSILRPRSALSRLSGETPGARTSAWVTRTPVMVLPTMWRRRSRAMVSASGSSGMALQLPVADVAAELLAFEGARLGGLAAPLGGLGHGGGDGGDGHHAAAARHESTVLSPGAGVEDDQVVRLLDPGGDVDLLALLVAPRVAAGGEDGGERGAVVPVERHPADRLAPRDGEHRLEERRGGVLE